MPEMIFWDISFCPVASLIQDMHSRIGFNSSTRLLEVGSGIGSLMFRMVQEFSANVTGVEINSNYVNLCNKIMS